MRRRDLVSFGLAMVAALPLRPAFGQSKYPERPIRLVIPFPPGGVYDAVGRPWAEKAKAQLGTIVIENVGGAGGSLGAAAVARAAADGYTILLGGGGPLIVNSVASSKPAYDALRDFEAIDLIAITGLAVVVNSAVPAQTLTGLIDHARANPGKLSYGSAGVGSVNHLAGELLKSLTGLSDIVHVPYRGAGPALTDLISGQIPIVMANVTGQLIELHRTGKVRILAVTTRTRLVGTPDVPTAVEQGLPAMISQNFIGLFAPAGTPRPIVGQISSATRAALGESEYQRMLLASGLEPVLDAGPDKTRKFVEEELARWTPLIRAVGLKID